MHLGFLLNLFRLAICRVGISARADLGFRTGVVLVGLFGLIGWGTSARADVADEAPIFVQHPAAATSIAPGNAVTLSAVVTGYPAPTLQWYVGAAGVLTYFAVDAAAVLKRG